MWRENLGPCQGGVEQHQVGASMGGGRRQQWTHHWCSIKKWGPCGMRNGAGGHVVVSHPFPRGGHKGGSNGNIQGPESVGTEEPAALWGDLGHCSWLGTFQVWVSNHPRGWVAIQDCFLKFSLLLKLPYWFLLILLSCLPATACPRGQGKPASTARRQVKVTEPQ